MEAISYLPFLTSAVILVFVILVLRRYLDRGGIHLLVWSIGLAMYGIGAFCEAHFAAFGWNDTVFRIWYYFGAMLVAAWLGQGTIYLLMDRKKADALCAVLVVLSVVGLVLIAGADVEPERLDDSSELTGKVMPRQYDNGTSVPWDVELAAEDDDSIDKGGLPAPRKFTPLLNVYGTVFLVGGALWSAMLFARRMDTLRDRVLGNFAIAIGAILPAMGGTMQRFGIEGVLYILELIGAILLFIGFMLNTRSKDRLVGGRKEEKGVKDEDTEVTVVDEE